MAKRHSNPSTHATGQLTLFDCEAKRRKLNLSHEDVEVPDHVSNADSEPTSTGSTIEEVPTTCTTRTQSSPNIPSTSQQQRFAHAPNLPSDISSGPSDKPAQPNRSTARFPSTVMGNKKRSFNPDWFRTYSWLEYSAERDAAFCFPCRHFSMGTGRAETAFTIDGFKDWKHATGKDGILPRHASCSTHTAAIQAWHDFTVNEEHGTSVANRLDSARNEQIRKNRHYLQSVAETILLCSRLEISLRGHDESSGSLNRGNFHEILQMVAKYDPVVKERLEQGPRNATYTSPDIQNMLLQIMGDMVRKSICDGVRQAGFFSLLADETKDASKKEQMAVVVRYVDERAVIQERFLTFVEAKNLTAESLTAYLISTLTKYQLDPACIVSQGYDGASVMSGSCSGVQQRLKEVAPYAMYVHCYAHTLNLALVDCVKSVQCACDFFCLLEALYVFTSASKAQAAFVAKQKELHPEKQVHRLQKLSDTRWACRQSAVNAICCTYDSLLAALEEISEGTDRARAVEATGFLFQIKTFKFLIMLVTFDRVLTCTKSLSDCLQHTHINLAKAADLVSATMSTLETFRTDEEWGKLFRYAEEVARVSHIDTTGCQPRQRQTPQRLQDGIVLAPTGARETMSTNEQYKVNLYFPVLDSFLAELQYRFSQKNINIMKAIQTFHPQSANFLEHSDLKPLALAYDLDYEALCMESTLARRTLKKAEMGDVSDVLLELMPLKAAFPTLLKAIQISLTISVSTAECERSFSALKRIKTHLRSTMTGRRLTDLSVLAIEKELTNKLSLDAVVTEFAAKDTNRRIVLM